MYCVINLQGEAKKEGISEMQFIHRLFDNMSEEEFRYNWIFFGTSGVHGRYTTLQELKDEISIFCREGSIEPNEYTEPRITTIIFMPRIMRSYYADFAVTSMEDALYLQHLAQKTFDGIVYSQDYTKYISKNL